MKKRDDRLIINTFGQLKGIILCYGIIFQTAFASWSWPVSLRSPRLPTVADDLCM